MEPVALALGLNDPAAMGEAVERGAGEAFGSEHLCPRNWNWHRFVWVDLPCWLGEDALFHGPRFSR